MEKLIFKKLNKDFTSFFLLTLFSITLIIWVIQAVNFLDLVIDDGHSFKIYFYYSLLNIPKIISKTLPFIFFLSIIYILLNYEGNNQLLIYWNTGITKINFIKKIVNYSFLYLLLQLMLTSYLVPSSQDFARSFFKNSNLNLLDGMIREKKFIATVKNLTIFTMSEEDGKFKYIFLKEKFDKNNYQIINSKTGKILPSNEKVLELNNGSILTRNEDGVSEIIFSQTSFNISKFKTKTVIDTKTRENSTSDLTKCVYYKILKKNKEKFIFFNCTEGNHKVIIETLYQRLMLPLFIPALALIASLIILKSRDEYKFGNYLTKVFLFGVVLIILTEVCIKYIGMNVLINISLVLSPFLCFFAIYFYIIRKLQY